MGATILIADDEIDIADLLADVLADEGYRVLLARDGREALVALERDRPDLLITDQRMPHLTGLDLIDHLHARPALAVPVILMSSAVPVPHPPPPTVFLEKPFDLDQLLTVVAHLCSPP